MIAIVDYGMGNLRSVEKALILAGGRCRVTDSPRQVARASAVVVPGVGAFGEAMKRLTRKRLVDPILEAIESNKPFLGICLGFQLLFDSSAEGRRQKGLGVLRGHVIRFSGPAFKRLKVPHIGWNMAHQVREVTLLKGMPRETYFYFVHSYYPEVEDRQIVATTTDYGISFCSSVCRGRLFASQFHPEKSSRRGQILLRNFVRLGEDQTLTSGYDPGD